MVTYFLSTLIELDVATVCTVVDFSGLSDLSEINCSLKVKHDPSCYVIAHHLREYLLISSP